MEQVKKKEVSGVFKKLSEWLETPEGKTEAADILRGCVGSVLEKNAGGKFKESIESSNKTLNDAISKIINELDKVSLKINKAIGNANLDDGSDTSFGNFNIGFHTDKVSGSNKVDKMKMTKSEIAPKANAVKNDDKYSVAVANLQKIATQEQQVITSFTSARLAVTKFLITQARKVWSSAAAYSSREHKNEGYEFYTAVGESAAYDFTSYMEAIGE